MSVMGDSVRKGISYRMQYLLRFCGVIDSIATLTVVTGVSVFGTLSVRNRSLGVEALVRIKVVIISRLRAHRTKLYLFLCWTSGGDPSSRLVRGFRSTTNMRGQCDCYSEVHSHCHGQVRQLPPNHRRERAL